jgi:hypothetical protein
VSAGDNDTSPVDPDTHIHPGDKEPVAMMTKAPPQFTIKPDSLFHRYPPGQIHIPVSKGGIDPYDLVSKSEENVDALTRNFSYDGADRFHCHDDVTPEAYRLGHPVI